MKKAGVIILIIIILLACIAFIVATFNLKISKNELFNKAINEGDYQDAYSFYLLREPITTYRPYLGYGDAPLTITIIVDFESEVGKNFYEEKIPQIIQESVNTGRARLFHKYLLTRDEYENKNGRFYYVLAAHCIKSNDTIELHTTLFNALQEGNGLNKELLDECLPNVIDFINQDMEETEDYRIRGPGMIIGVDGRENTFLFGNPDMEIIKKRIRLKEILVGI